MGYPKYQCTFSFCLKFLSKVENKILIEISLTCPYYNHFTCWKQTLDSGWWPEPFRVDPQREFIRHISWQTGFLCLNWYSPNQPTSHPLTPKLLFTLSLQHLTISKQCLPFSVSRKESLQSGRLHRQLFNFRRAQPPRHRTWEDDDRDEYSGRGSCPSSFYVWTDAWAELLKLS